MLKKYSKIKSLLSLAVLSLALVLGACDSKDDDATTGTELKSFGPSVFRGGPLNFIGNNLNNVTSIVLPDGIEILASEFVSKTSTLIVVMVPEEAVSGKVIVKTAKGDIETKTELSILEPITITSITPAKARPGDEITIEGTYLNLIEVAVFKDTKKVETFTSQSKTTITLIVPEDAQTGTITLLDGEEIPNAIESKDQLQITLPVPTNVAPLTIKAGGEITITGTDLDLTKEVKFGGDRSVTTFVSKTATQIVVKVPANAQDGKIKLIAASGVASESTQALTLVIPTLTAVTPNPAKNSANITVTGTNLDLITSVVFGGDKTGAIQAGGTATQITVKVPMDAVDGMVKFNTDANKSVSIPLTLVVPTITSFTPSVNTSSAPSITINGTNLDIVASVVFAGNWISKDITVVNPSQIVVKVKPGSVTGKFTLVTTNGIEIQSATDLTIVPDMPAVTSVSPSGFFIGDVITISAPSGLDILFDVLFPNGADGIKAVSYVTKTATTLKVRVPVGTTKGRIKLINYANEVYEIPIDVKLAGTEPVQNAALVFFDFDANGKWWGNTTVENNPTFSNDGTNYATINTAATGWTDLFWRNAIGNFNGATTVGTHVADYVIKFDIQWVSPLTDGNIKFRLHEGGGGDFWWLYGPKAPSGTVIPAGTWITVTVPISSFKDGDGWGTNSPTDMSKITAEYGMAFDNGISTLNFRIDNVRFHKIN